jgi:hypothetical protein
MSFASDTVSQERRLLSRLNAVRLCLVIFIAIGYASTMPRGPEYSEILNLYGYDPSWFGIQLLFFLSGLMAMRSLEQGRAGIRYLRSRFLRNIPLLAALTVLTLLILFPLFGTPHDEGLDFWMRLGKYIALTVFCIDPGVPIQGLMDDAKYMCLVQGSIWTLRYGAIMHIITAVSGKIDHRLYRPFISLAALGSTVLYLIMSHWTAVNAIDNLAVPLTALRLSYAFLIGMALWSHRAQLLRMGKSLWALPLGFVFIASVNYIVSWTSLIEVALTLAWMSLSFILLTQPHALFDRLKNWPDLTLTLLLINWPVAQTILLFREDWPLAIFIPLSVSLSLLLSYTARQLWDQNIGRLSAKRKATH